MCPRTMLRSSTWGPARRGAPAPVDPAGQPPAEAVRAAGGQHRDAATDPQRALDERDRQPRGAGSSLLVVLAGHAPAAARRPSGRAVPLIFATADRDRHRRVLRRRRVGDGDRRVLEHGRVPRRIVRGDRQPVGAVGHAGRRDVQARRADLRASVAGGSPGSSTHVAVAEVARPSPGGRRSPRSPRLRPRPRRSSGCERRITVGG